MRTPLIGFAVVLATVLSANMALNAQTASRSRVDSRVWAERTATGLAFGWPALPGLPISAVARTDTTCTRLSPWAVYWLDRSTSDVPSDIYAIVSGSVFSLSTELSAFLETLMAVERNAERTTTDFLERAIRCARVGPEEPFIDGSPLVAACDSIAHSLRARIVGPWPQEGIVDRGGVAEFVLTVFHYLPIARSYRPELLVVVVDSEAGTVGWASRQGDLIPMQ